MEERQPPPPRNPSRTLAMVGVAVLVVIAIAGIVLASLQKGLPDDGAVAADPTHAASAAMTDAAASAAAAEAEGRANEVVFAADSARLSSAATAKLQGLAEAAKTDKRLLTIVGRVEVRGEGKEQRSQLARNRAIAVRSALEANGVPLARMQTRIEETALAPAAAAYANRIEVNPR
jgi:outer membrane protein OmpA-like peptidoglycan-associated protein